MKYKRKRYSQTINVINKEIKKSLDTFVECFDERLQTFVYIDKQTFNEKFRPLKSNEKLHFKELEIVK